MTNDPSDSSAQQSAENDLIGSLSNSLAVSLAQRTLELGNGKTVQVDGYSEDKKVIAEAYAHIGRLKPGQKKKLGHDVLKLITIEKALGDDWEKYIVVADGPAEKYLTDSSWLSVAVEKFGINIVRADIGPEIKTGIEQAQREQTMVNPNRSSRGYGI